MRKWGVSWKSLAHSECVIDGVWYPSVTTILSDRPKPWLQKWREKWGVLADRKVKAACDIGDAFHAATEKLARREWVDEPHNRRLAGMLRRIDTWLTSEGFNPVDQELHLVSYAYKFSGTLDATGYLAGNRKELVLVDWKTSSGIYGDMGLQLVAYAQAYFEKTGIRIKRGLIVHVSKDKPHHKLTVKEFKIGKRELNKFLKRLTEFRKYAVKRKTNAELGPTLPIDGIQRDPATAAG